MLSRTHTADTTFELPECTDNSLEYYRMQGRYLETADKEAILGIIKSDIDDQTEQTNIQFSTPEIYNQAMSQIDVILQEAAQYQVDSGGQGTERISYQYNENTCVLTVFWAA